MKRVLQFAVIALFATGGGVAGAFAMRHWQPTGARAAVAAPAATPATALPLPVAAANAGTAIPEAQLSDADWPADAPSPEQVMYAQPALMEDAIARLRPRTPGKVNLYAIVFAGDGSENVFRNEAAYFGQLLSRRLGAAGHVLVLENNPAALTTRPLATWSNLETALDAVAQKMDPAEDVLMVYLTTHGSEGHTLLVDMDPLPLDQIGAGDLAQILREHPFRYKVVIVNACYSGGFIPPLKSPGTLIITAARSDRSSFGCDEQSELTWFGHAFLVDALNRTADLQQAFRMARGEIAGWELRDHYRASDPQLWAGAGIAAQLRKWRAGFVPGPSVPFAPAPTRAPAAK